MRKHARKTRRRPIAIAAIALGALAIPSAAMACINDQSAEAATPHGHGKYWKNWKNASLDDRRENTWAPSHSPVSTSPTATTSASPTPTASPKVTASTSPTATASTSPKATASPSAPSGTATPASAAVARVLALVNSERSKAGCSAVTLNAKLAKAAQDHSVDMAAHKNMSHTGSDGSDPGERITRAGYDWQTYGENVAYGYSTPEQVMAGWMSSPGHKRNILTCAFKEIGIGLAQPGNYWTQDFATAR
ncbi:CAP domain-containing protein [Streptomyces sp. NPDC096132]|uniref:CAP domain-containing protein n=1 Tax=Streptomyces sp. NPDC096132 TaxID=3366075 RepID=UPI0038110409